MLPLQIGASCAITLLCAIEEYALEYRRLDPDEQGELIAARAMLRSAVLAAIPIETDRFYRCRSRVAPEEVIFAPAGFKVEIDTVTDEGILVQGWHRPYTDAREKIEIVFVPVHELIEIDAPTALTLDPVLFACLDRLIAGDESVIEADSVAA